MKSWKTPTAQQVSLALANMSSLEQQRYFFDKLANPNWLPVLTEKGFFAQPPELLSTDDNSRTEYPKWPVLRYLTRIAVECPAEIAAIIAAVPGTQNLIVTDELLTIACLLPAEFLKPLGPKILAWASSDLLFFSYEKVGTLMARLADAGECTAAIKLAKSLLQVSSEGNEPSPVQSERGIERLYDKPRAKTRIGSSAFEDILKKDFPSLHKKCGLKAIKVLCDSLQRWLKLSSYIDDPNDYSFIWRPKIEHDDDNIYSGPREHLIDAIRDGALALLKDDPAIFSALQDVLERRPFPVFRRILLFLAKEAGPAQPQAISHILANHESFEDVNIEYEYSQLLGTFFGDLSQSAQAEIVQWIQVGPDMELIKEYYMRNRGIPASEEFLARYLREWQFKRLQWIHSGLKGESLELYQELAKSQENVSPAPPLLPADKHDELVALLRSQEIVWVANYLREHVPEKTLEPWRQGQEVSALSIVARERVHDFCSRAEEFKEVAPSYMSALFSVFVDAIRRRDIAEFAPVLRLARWVTEQPLVSEEERAAHSNFEEIDYEYTLRQIAEFMRTALSQAPVPIPLAERTIVWSILSSLSNDHEPTQEWEVSNLAKPSFDVASASLNVTRGIALHSAMHYALWIRKETLNEGKEWNGFQSTPELRDLLDRHLDPAHEPSLIVRSVYGKWFPWLMGLDKEWTQSAVQRIFGSSSELDLISFAVPWSTYIRNQPYDDNFDCLREYYGTAVAQMSNIGQLLPEPNLADDLGFHLAIYYVRGRISETDSLWTTFWRTATTQTCEDVIKQLGRSIKATNPLQEPVRHNLMKLWQARMASVDDSTVTANKSYLQAFGWWFASKRFDPSWALEQIVRVIDLVGNVQPEDDVLDEILVCALNHPESVFKAMGALVKSKHYMWHLHYRSSKVYEIFALILRGDIQNRQQVLDLIDHYGRQGFVDLKSLL
jgi:hypothetical protein